MKKIETYKVIDIRAEVLLAELILKDKQYQLENLALQPNGGFNKMVGLDIVKISESNNEFDIKKTMVTLARSGLYDALPEAYFNDSSIDTSSPDTRQSKKDRTIQKLKQQKINEREARKFFSPFDQLFNQYRLKLELEERKVLTGFPVGSRHTLFDVIWGNFEGIMTKYQKSLLFTILPMTQHIVGNIPRTALTYREVLGVNVKIKDWDTSGDIKLGGLENPNYTLGHTSLGESLVLGNQSEECEQGYKIIIGPIPEQSTIDFLPDHRGKKVLKTLGEFFFSYDVNLSYEFIYQTKPLELIENKGDQSSSENRLGYTIQLTS